MRAAAPNCEVNGTVYDDPTGGRWRYVDYNDKAYIFILHRAMKSCASSSATPPRTSLSTGTIRSTELYQI